MAGFLGYLRVKSAMRLLQEIWREQLDCDVLLCQLRQLLSNAPMSATERAVANLEVVGNREVSRFTCLRERRPIGEAIEPSAIRCPLAIF